MSDVTAVSPAPACGVCSQPFAPTEGFGAKLCPTCLPEFRRLLQTNAIDIALWAANTARTVSVVVRPELDWGVIPEFDAEGVVKDRILAYCGLGGLFLATPSGLDLIRAAYMTSRGLLPGPFRCVRVLPERDELLVAVTLDVVPFNVSLPRSELRWLTTAEGAAGWYQ